MNVYVVMVFGSLFGVKKGTDICRSGLRGRGEGGGGVF